MKLLLVEDTKFFTQAVVQGLTQKLKAEVCVAYTRAEALALLKSNPQAYDFAMVDIVLPDSDKGEIVDDVLNHNIPTVVFTGGISPDLRQNLLKKPIIDYVLKDSPSSLTYLFDLMERLIKNTEIEVLVVDDSRSYRMFVGSLLERHRLTVHEAEDAESALKVLAENPQIRLALVDQNMPKVTGIELIKRIRRTRGPESLGIIGLSSNKNPELSVKFIKYGANDFLPKDFRHEELFCRVSQNLNLLDMLGQLKDAATKDFLTGLKNRRSFYETGAQLLAKTRSNDSAATLALLDLDHFKDINDSFGHDIGDTVLKKVAECIDGFYGGDDIVARIGGEEFAIMSTHMDRAKSEAHFEELRATIESIQVECVGQLVPISCSIGVVQAVGTELEPIMKHADELLYLAKDNGRNRVEFADNYGTATPARSAS